MEQRSAFKPSCAVAVTLVLLSACQGGEQQLRSRIAGFGESSAIAGPGPLASLGSLHAVVEGAQVVEHLAPSRFEERRAAPGNRLLVLDVSVRNGGRRPRVFSEGSLVAEDRSGTRSRSAPVDMLSDGFLSLQVLQPGDRVRGRIVFEVPYTRGSRFYWVSAQDGREVLVEPVPPSQAAPVRRPVATRARAAKRVATTRPAPVEMARVATRPVVVPPFEEPARAAAALPASSGAAVAKAADPYALDAATQAACTGLVVRNDPAEKSRQLAFFERECRGYDLPVSWTLAYRNFFG